MAVGMRRRAAEMVPQHAALGPPGATALLRPLRDLYCEAIETLGPLPRSEPMRAATRLSAQSGQEVATGVKETQEVMT